MKKLATNIPEELLEEARAVTGLNQTQTIILGLKELIAKKKRDEFLELKGRVKVDCSTKFPKKF